LGATTPRRNPSLRTSIAVNMTPNTKTSIGALLPSERAQRESHEPEQEGDRERDRRPDDQHSNPQTPGDTEQHDAGQERAPRSQRSGSKAERGLSGSGVELRQSL